MPTRSPTAGGVLIAAGAILGTLVGVFASQPTLGFLTGTGIGVVVALMIWWKDR